MKTESNRGINSHTQSMAGSNFPLVSHLFPLPLVMLSGKHHAQKPMLLHLLTV